MPRRAGDAGARLPHLNNRWQRLGLGSKPAPARIAASTPPFKRLEFGSEGRMTYTAIGLQTNIAARLTGGSASLAECSSARSAGTW